MNEDRSKILELLQAAKEILPAQPTAINAVLRTWFFKTPHDDYDLLNNTLCELRFAVDERAHAISPLADIKAMLDETITLMHAKDRRSAA